MCWFGLRVAVVQSQMVDIAKLIFDTDLYRDETNSFSKRPQVEQAPRMMRLEPQLRKLDRLQILKSCCGRWVCEVDEAGAQRSAAGRDVPRSRRLFFDQSMKHRSYLMQLTMKYQKAISSRDGLFVALCPLRVLASRAVFFCWSRDALKSSLSMIPAWLVFASKESEFQTNKVDRDIWWSRETSVTV